MPSHSKHHYVPKFLLQAWESGKDRKLSSFRWNRDQILEERYKAKSVAKQKNLYSIQAENQTLERDVMGVVVDEPAALVHKQIISQGLGSLTPEQRIIWSRFMTSLVLRVPGAVELIRDVGRRVLHGIVDTDPGGLHTDLSVGPEVSLRSHVEKTDPAVFDDFGLMNLPDALQNTKFTTKFSEAQWRTRCLSSSSQKLLIVDRPLTLFGAFNDQYFVYLPLTPHLAFIAGSDERHSMSSLCLPESEFVAQMNAATIRQASEFVYGVDDAHLQLIERLLERSPAGPGLGLGPRPAARV